MDKQEPPQCCGQPMEPTDLRIGIRVWQCTHRVTHQALLEVIATGERELEGEKHV